MRVGMLALAERLKINEQVHVALFGIKPIPCGRPKQLQPSHAKAPANLGDFGSTLCDRHVHMPIVASRTRLVDDVAATVSHLAGVTGRFITGATILVDGGYAA